MSENKPFPATEEKKKKSRKDGDVARSPELTGSFVMIAGFVLGMALIGPVLYQLTLITEKCFSFREC